MTTDNPFAAVEKRLMSPPVDGVMLTLVDPDSPLHSAGARPGDVIVALDGKGPPSLRALYECLRPADDATDALAATVRLSNGASVEASLPRDRRGFAACDVKRARTGWDDWPDGDHEPDLSAFADGTDLWWRNSLGGTPAGFEHARIRATDEHIEIDSLMWIGGKQPDGATWSYRARGETKHRRDRWMSITRTAFWEGDPGDEVLKGDVHFDGERWTGVHGAAGGRQEDVGFPPFGGPAVTPYRVAFLALTMPLRQHAALTFYVAGDGTGRVTCRNRLICTGRAKVDVAGRSVDAWRFEWKHYGEYGGNELFFVTDDRRLVRIEWGPNYSGCVSEAVSADEVMVGAPAHIRME